MRIRNEPVCALLPTGTKQPDCWVTLVGARHLAAEGKGSLVALRGGKPEPGSADRCGRLSRHVSVTGRGVGCGGGRVCGAAVLGIWNQRQENRGENSRERLRKRNGLGRCRCAERPPVIHSCVLSPPNAPVPSGLEPRGQRSLRTGCKKEAGELNVNENAAFVILKRSNPDRCGRHRVSSVDCNSLIKANKRPLIFLKPCTSCSDIYGIIHLLGFSGILRTHEFGSGPRAAIPVSSHCISGWRGTRERAPR